MPSMPRSVRPRDGAFPLRYPITSPSVPWYEHDMVLALPCRMVQVVVTLRSPSRASRRLVRPLPRSRRRRTASIRSGVAGGLAGKLIEHNVSHEDFLRSAAEALRLARLYPDPACIPTDAEIKQAAKETFEVWREIYFGL